MRIAVFGTKVDGKKREKQLHKFFSTIDYDVQIDLYDNTTALVENIYQYDSIFMTDEAIDLITGVSSGEVIFEWGKKIRICNVRDVYYAEADLKNVHIWFANEETVVHLPFSKVEQILGIGDFIKVHRSYIVNCMYIQKIDEHTVTLKDGREVPLSKYRSEDVRKQYAEYMRTKREKLNNGENE